MSTAPYQRILSSGEFADEAEACARLDELVRASGAFSIYPEVCGEYLQPRMGSPDKTPRIDRILVPKLKLTEAGWPHGPIGIECKTSGKKLGPILAQALDYSRAVWSLPEQKTKTGDSGWRIMLQWIFIWPINGADGDLGSAMAQNRIGWVRSSSRCPLVFGCGGTHGITVNSDGSVEAKRFQMGNKAGSR